MARMSRLVALAGLCWLAAVPTSSADPVTITSGLLTAIWSPQPGGSTLLAGTRGFSLDARVSPGEGRIDVLTNCDSCVPGAPLSVAGILSGAAFSGVATLDGQAYTDLGGISGPTSIYMEFFGNTVLPAFQNTEVLVTLPFSMMGVFNLPGTQEVLRGRGLASVLLRPANSPEGPRQWIGQQVTYDFGNQATVPEPSTMILVGGGLIAIARRISRRSSVGSHESSVPIVSPSRQSQSVVSGQRRTE